MAIDIRAGLLVACVALGPLAVRADQCAALSKAQVVKAAAELRRAKKFVEFCEPCGDKAPGPVKALGWLDVREEGGAYSLLLDHVAKDIAYIFTEVSPGRFANLAATSACPTQSVSEAVTIGIPNLCAAREMVVFACMTTKLKYVSLCGEKGLLRPIGTLHYRYGMPDEVELTISGPTGAGSKFSKMDDHGTGAWERGIGVENAGHRYYVVWRGEKVVPRGASMAEAIGVKESLGVEISMPGGKSTTVECAAGMGGFSDFKSASKSLP